MPQPIVVGLDPLREQAEPLALATALAGLTGAPVVAVAAHPVHDLPTGLVPPGYDALMRDRAEAALARARRQLPAAAASRAVASPSAARALHDVADEVDAALVVVGAADPAAEGLLNGGGWPVAVAPSGYEPPPAIARVGAAFADTPEGRAAVAAAGGLARAAGAALTVVTAVQPVDGTGVVAPGRAYHEALELARLAADDRAAAAAAELAPGVPATVRAVAESADVAVAAASKHVDVLVCGSRGYGPAGRVLLGRVSRRLSRTAECPLIVLPRKVATALDERVEARVTIGA